MTSELSELSESLSNIATITPAHELALSQPTEGSADDVSAGLARATTILAVGNIASRVLGFAKEILLSNFFGASKQVDAFQIAITIPQDLYDLAIFGHTNSAIVPVLTEYAARKNRAELWRVVSALLSLLLLATGLLTLAMIFLAPQVIMLYRGRPGGGLILQPFALTVDMLRLTAPGMSLEAFNLSVELLRLTAPALIFMSLFAVVSGMLYSLKRFVWPAFAAALFNGTIVIVTIAFAPSLGIQGVAVGWVLGAIAQLALQVGGLRGARLRLMIAELPVMLRHPGLRRIGLLYLPVLFTLVIDVLINRTFSYNIASQTGEGNIAYMNWATSLREFPMGLVGTAISIAILPTLARQALSSDLLSAFRDTLGKGMRLALTLIIPASVGMFVLAGPLIGLVFEHGAFTAENTFAMSGVLRLYLVGIPFAAIDLLLIFAFYARRDSLTPALIGVFSLLCYVGVTLLLLPHVGFLSLMIADSVKHLVHMTISLLLLRRKLGGLGSQRLLPTLFKVLIATTVMALITYALVRGVAGLWVVQGLRERLILVLLPGVLGGLTYLLLASWLRLNELSLFIRALTRRIRP